MTRKEEQIKYIDEQFKNSVNCDIVFEEVPFHTLHEYLLNCNWTDDELGNDEWINGWQVDFWWYMYNPEGVRYCLSGSLYYQSDIHMYEAND